MNRFMQLSGKLSWGTLTPCLLGNTTGVSKGRYSRITLGNLSRRLADAALILHLCILVSVLALLRVLLGTFGNPFEDFVLVSVKHLA